MLDSDWFFLDRDFQYGNGLNGNGLKLLIFLFAKAGKFKICNLNYKKKPLAQRSYLRAIVPKFRLEVCKMKKSKIPKLCQNIGLDELFLEKIL